VVRQQTITYRSQIPQGKNFMKKLLWKTPLTFLLLLLTTIVSSGQKDDDRPSLKEGKVRNGTGLPAAQINIPDSGSLCSEQTGKQPEDKPVSTDGAGPKKSWSFTFGRETTDSLILDYPEFFGAQTKSRPGIDLSLDERTFGFKKFNDLQVFSQVGIGFKQRMNSKKDADRANEQAAHELNPGVGAFLPFRRAVFTSELNLSPKRWNRGGTEREIYFMPGVV
jgi:hypothetical protein